MPWDLARTRTDVQIQPSAEGIVQEIGASGRQVAQFAYQGRVGLGAGIAHGIETATEIFERARAREQDPANQYRRMMLERQAATDEVIRGTSYQTPEEHYGGPIGATGERANPLPPIDKTAAHLWQRATGHDFSRLPPAAQGRVSQIVGQMQQTRVPMYEETPQMRSAMAKADPSTVAKLKEEGFTSQSLPEGLERQFRDAVYRDSVVQQALIHQDIEDAPIRQAEAQGRAPLADVLRSIRGDVQATKAAEALFPVFESRAPINFFGTKMTASEAAALKPDLTLDEIQTLTGEMTVRAPSVMINEKGQLVDDITKQNAWLRGQGDSQAYLATLAGLPWYEKIHAAHTLEQGKAILAGLRGRGPWKLDFLSGGKPEELASRTRRIANSMKLLTERYGETEIAGLIAQRFLGLPGTDAQILGDQKVKASKIAKELDDELQLVLTNPGAMLGGIPAAAKRLLSKKSDQEWESQLSNSSMRVQGPLQDYSSLPAPLMQSIWRGFGESLRQNPAWTVLQESLASKGLAGPQLLGATSVAFSEFDSLRRFMEADFPKQDPNGRKWADVPPKEKDTQLRALGDAVVEHLFGAGPTEKLSPDAREALPAPEQPAQRSAPEAQKLFDEQKAIGAIDGKGIVEIRQKDGTAYIAEDGKFSHAVDLATNAPRPDPSKDQWGGVKEGALIPAQDVYRFNKEQMGFKDPSESWLYFNTRLPALRSQAPLVSEVLGDPFNGRSFYRQIQETLERGKGLDLRTAYDAVMSRLSHVAAENRMTVGDLQKEFDVAAAREPSEPVISAVAVMLEQAFAGETDGSNERDLMRTTPNVQQMMMPGAGRIRDLTETEPVSNPMDRYDSDFEGFSRGAQQSLPEPLAGAVEGALNGLVKPIYKGYRGITEGRTNREVNERKAGAADSMMPPEDVQRWAQRGRK
jgi:hypothetical protein